MDWKPSKMSEAVPGGIISAKRAAGGSYTISTYATGQYQLNAETAIVGQFDSEAAAMRAAESMEAECPAPEPAIDNAAVIRAILGGGELVASYLLARKCMDRGMSGEDYDTAIGTLLRAGEVVFVEEGDACGYCLAHPCAQTQASVQKSDYCTQNAGDCSSCSLVNYGRDCRNHKIDWSCRRCGVTVESEGDLMGVYCETCAARRRAFELGDWSGDAVKTTDTIWIPDDDLGDWPIESEGHARATIADHNACCDAAICRDNFTTAVVERRRDGLWEYASSRVRDGKHHRNIVVLERTGHTYREVSE